MNYEELVIMVKCVITVEGFNNESTFIALESIKRFEKLSKTN